MNRRGLVRLQLTLLAVLALLVLIRMITGPPDPSGLVVFIDLKPNTLVHQAFEVQQPARVTVRATGSFDPEAVPTALAAYGWILRRADREVVWTMDPATVEAGRGTTARVRGDTLALEAGLYDVYYATYGAIYGERGRRWRNDDEAWQLVLQPTDDDARVRALPDQDLDDLARSTGHVVWTSAPMHDDQQNAYLFEVKRPTRLQLYAVGEIESGQDDHDYAWIEDATTDTRVWQMTQDNTWPAGGLARNRVFRGDLMLEPGTYRAVAVTNGEHAFDDWEGSPPFDPAAWGLTLLSEEAGAVVAFDPWPTRTPLISFTRVPDDAERHQRFEVTQPIQVVAYTVGEITDRNSLYDYGELLKEEGGRLSPVWKMSYEASAPAGGADKNRQEVAFLRLDPGRYLLRYQTDGSHSFEDWNARSPDFPERWGVTLFPMAPSLPEGAFRLLAGDATASHGTHAPPPEPIAHEGDPLVAWSRMQNDADKQHRFSLNKPTRLHIVALGEITLSGQHDYGWIERADGGEKVWEMTLDNTHPAGGTDRNRRFDGIITLAPGRYVARFKSDFSHHYGDFGSEAPDEPAAWGMTLYRVAGGEAGGGGEN